MSTVAEELSPRSRLVRAIVATAYYKMMKSLLVACIENGLTLIAMIKMGE